MALEKIYTPIGWQNKPSTATPLGSHNLSKMDEALDEIDTRLVGLSEDTEELDEKVRDAEADITQNAQDITSLSNSFNGFSVAINALKIVPTASGTTAYMDDASNMGLEGIDFFGESTQNGTPTPTSQIPIESKIVEKVIVSGKNFFGFGESAIDKTTELRPLAYQRLIFTKIDDNTIKCNHTGGTYSTGYVEIEGIDGTKDYAFSFIVEHNTLGFTPRIEKYASRCTTTRLSLMIYAGNGTTEVASSEYIILKNIQVELGTTATPFEPYKPIQTVNLSAPIELNGIGDVKDTDKLKKFGVVVLDGSEAWYKHDEQYPHLFKTSITPYANGNAPVLCSHFLYDSGDLLGGNDGCRFRLASSADVFYISSSKHTDVSAFKSWLASNPVTLVYELAEPIETELPQADQTAIKNLHSYKPNTVVMNDADAEMDVSYVADGKIYIDRKFEVLASAIVNQ